MTQEETELVRGSGNVFCDSGDPDADIRPAKAILASQIIAVIDGIALSARKAASMTGFAVAGFSRVRNAGLGRLTLVRLIKMLWTPADSIKVTIQLAPRPAGQGTLPLPV
jgi:acyl-CoA synthetase (NDP forming)